MILDYFVEPVPIGKNQMAINRFEYWISISGNPTVFVGSEAYHMDNHSIIEIPKNTEITLVTDTPVVLGKIVMINNDMINMGVRYYSNAYCETITNTFLFAISWEGLNVPNKSYIRNSIEQLIKNICISLDLSNNTLNKDVALIIQKIKAEYANPYFNLSQEIDHTGYSPSRFRYLFKRDTTYSPNQFLNQFRIEQAKNIIDDFHGSITVNEVANRVGFSDQYYFSRKFKQIIGVSPINYIQETLQEGK